MGIHVNHSWVDQTRGCRIGDSDVFESYMQTPSEVYRESVKEFGRCIGKVYVDGPNGEALHVGWIFRKRQRFEDARDSWPKGEQTYLQDTWVTMHTGPDEVKRTRNYLPVN